MKRHEDNTNGGFTLKAKKSADSMYNPFCRVYVKDHGDFKEYDVYLTEEISSVDAYTDLLNSLFAMTEDDVMHLKINSPGGLFDTGLQIQDAIKNCKGDVIGYLSGGAHSAASGILLACDGFVIHPLSSMLVHNASGGAAGSMQDVVDTAQFMHKQTAAWMRNTYKYFLSEEEMEDLIKNKREMYLMGDEILERLQRKVELEMQELEDAGEEFEREFDFVEAIKALQEAVTRMEEKLDEKTKPAPRAKTRTRKKAD